MVRVAAKGVNCNRTTAMLKAEWTVFEAHSDSAIRFLWFESLLGSVTVE